MDCCIHGHVYIYQIDITPQLVQHSTTHMYVYFIYILQDMGVLGKTKQISRKYFVIPQSDSAVVFCYPHLRIPDCWALCLMLVYCLFLHSYICHLCKPIMKYIRKGITSFLFFISVPHEVFTAAVSNVGNCNVHRKCSLWQKVITIWGVHTT